MYCIAVSVHCSVVNTYYFQEDKTELFHKKAVLHAPLCWLEETIFQLVWLGETLFQPAWLRETYLNYLAGRNWLRLGWEKAQCAQLAWTVGAELAQADALTSPGRPGGEVNSYPDLSRFGNVEMTERGRLGYEIRGEVAGSGSEIGRAGALLLESRHLARKVRQLAGRISWLASWLAGWLAGMSQLAGGLAAPYKGELAGKNSFYPPSSL